MRSAVCECGELCACSDDGPCWFCDNGEEFVCEPCHEAIGEDIEERADLTPLAKWLTAGVLSGPLTSLLPTVTIRPDAAAGVYFLAADDLDRVKIGHTSRGPYRPYGLAVTGQPCDIRIVGWIDAASKEAAHALENELHDTLDHDRIRGEWFRASPFLIGFLSSQKNAATRSTT